MIEINEDWFISDCNDNETLPWCASCKHAINRREWEDKINYGNGTYDIMYCEEITCNINGVKFHPSQFGCDGKYFKEL